MPVPPRRSVPCVALAVCIVAGTLAGCANPQAPPPDQPTKVEQPELPKGELVTPPPSEPLEEIGASAVIGAEGGEVATKDGAVKLTVPPGAVSRPTNFTIDLAPPAASPLEGAAPVGELYDITPADVALEKPVEVEVKLKMLRLAALDLAKGMPLLAALLRPAQGPSTPLAEATVTYDLPAREVVFDGHVQALGYVYVGRSGASVKLVPWDQTGFVGEAWDARAIFDGAAGDRFTNITEVADRPVVVKATQPRPEGVQGDATVVLPFACEAPGRGAYGITFAAEAALDGPEGPVVRGDYELREPAHCLEKPTLSATLAPPRTLFHANAPLPSSAPPDALGPGRVFYVWLATLSCGVFNATGTRNATGGMVRTTFAGPDADWAHPNAPPPPPDRSAEDADRDGIPDFCPHSEVPNFSHAGNLTLLLHYRDPYRLGTPQPDPDFEDADTIDPGYAGEVLCTYSGSLSGSGTCVPSYLGDLTRVFGMFAREA